MRGNSSTEIKHIPWETFLKMRRNWGVFFLFFFCLLFSLFLLFVKTEQLVKMAGRFFVCIYKLKSDSLQLNIILWVFF